MSAVVFRGDEGEVLRQASAVVERPVVLWEIIGPHQAVPRASSGPDVGTRPPGFDLDAILQRWSIPVPVGSRWITALAGSVVSLWGEPGDPIVDFRHLDESGAWLRTKLTSRPLGHSDAVADWTNVFDGVVFTRIMYPSTLAKRAKA